MIQPSSQANALDAGGVVTTLESPIALHELVGNCLRVSLPAPGHRPTDR
jgi:hypothetical protein